MEKELDEEAPQHEDDVRRSAPFSPAALLSMGGQPSTPRVRRAGAAWRRSFTPRRHAQNTRRRRRGVSSTPRRHAPTHASS